MKTLLAQANAASYATLARNTSDRTKAVLYQNMAAKWYARARGEA